jgi:UDP-glucose 4-epimerase
MTTTRPAANIVVTGGEGFVGSHLVRALANTDAHITVIDNNWMGLPHRRASRINYVCGHTKDIADLAPERVDTIFHLGEYSRVGTSLAEPNTVWNLNIAGSLAVLEFWRARQCRLIYAGSSTRFSSPIAQDKAAQNLSPYTWAKAAIADLIKNYHSWYNLSYAVVYLYSVYGPGELDNRYGTLIGSLARRYFSQLPLEISAPGTQTRSFTHVDDAVRGIVLVSEAENSGEYPIATDDVYALLDVAEMFGGEITITPTPATARSHVAPDVSHIRNLDWRPSHNLRSYIAELKQHNCKQEVKLENGSTSLTRYLPAGLSGTSNLKDT